MNSPLDIDSTVSAELTRLRRHVRELQQALVQSEQDRRLAQASALEAAQVGTWEWQADTNRVSWSAETEQIFGLRPGSFVGTYEGFFALVHPDDRQQLGTAIATAVDERTFYLIEHRIITPHGDTRWVACRGRALCRENESLSGMVGTVEDITTRKQSELAQQAMHEFLETQVWDRTAGLERAVIELKQEVARRQQAESALKTSEQRYESLYEHNPFMYFTLASDGIVLSVNRFGAEQLG
ncbi:MAG: PAS domain-containing protein, partial [Nitrospira sp.]|nr:PAS domain-containing protein [Nitrospira sp.]